MARYINADALIEQMKNSKYVVADTPFYIGVNDAIDYWISKIENLSSADVAPKAEIASEVAEAYTALARHYVMDRDLYLAVFKNALAYTEAELKHRYS